MKRIFVAAILSVTALAMTGVGASLASASNAGQASAVSSTAKHCHVRNGYSPAYCRVVYPGRWVGFHIPGFTHNQLELYVRSHLHSATDVQVENVTCPTTTGLPKGADCFGMDFFSHATGKTRSTVGQAIAFVGAIGYGFNPQNNRFHKLSDNKSLTAGVFAFVP